MVCPTVSVRPRPPRYREAVPARRRQMVGITIRLSAVNTWDPGSRPARLASSTAARTTLAESGEITSPRHGSERFICMRCSLTALFQRDRCARSTKHQTCLPLIPVLSMSSTSSQSCLRNPEQAGFFIWLTKTRTQALDQVLRATSAFAFSRA